eukprot:CAMPEP_0184392002 /NCGR_PEP_ID=MMETSP0007-20130409/21949_1 /TAXON_ID=97485 /ORGANISM="Prymnesium parvum, Strain Texoma1" /LENGTH=138 /DNA_ID=CAMNT_0026742391 /DNA_START=432 /DNA_END=849 /DNA_ORIENTATION=+
MSLDGPSCLSRNEARASDDVVDIVSRREPLSRATRLVSAFCSSNEEMEKAQTSPTRLGCRESLIEDSSVYQERAVLSDRQPLEGFMHVDCSATIFERSLLNRVRIHAEQVDVVALQGVVPRKVGVEAGEEAVNDGLRA